MRSIIIKSISLSLLAMPIAGCDTHVSSEVETVEYVDCSPFAWRIEKDEFYQHTKCGTVDETGLIQLNQEVVELMDFAKYKEALKNNSAEDQSMFPTHLQCLPIWPAIYGKGGSAYFNEHGKGRLTPVWDSNCMPFSNGISYTYVDGNIAYFNTDLDIVKQTNYRFANGRLVCSEIPHKYYRPGTFEHPEWRGGVCGRIDENFDIIVPLKYAYEQVLSKTSNTENDKD